MPIPDDLRTLTVEKTAEILGVHAESVRRYAREGRLAAYKVGRRLRFRPQAIEEFLEGCRLQVPDPAEFIRRARRGKARGGGRRTARRGAGLPGQFGRAAAGPQPGGAARPGAAARFSPEQPGVSASVAEPAAAVR